MLVIGKIAGTTSEATRFTITQHLWFAEDVGIVKDVIRPFTIPLPGFPSYSVFGAERLLLRYNVVK
jgi:hypothetical protein